MSYEALCNRLHAIYRELNIDALEAQWRYEASFHLLEALRAFLSGVSTMKFPIFRATAFLTSLVFCTTPPIPRNGVLPGSPPSPKPPTCTADAILRTLENSSRNVGASSFCSAYIQASITTSPSNISQTILPVVPTNTDTVTICGNNFSNAPASCGLEGYGFEEYLIFQIQHTSPTGCHLSCLADWNCHSFQTQLSGVRMCNLYSAPVSGSIQTSLGAGYLFYDDTCLNYLPGPCASTTLAATTSSSTFSIPSYLATVPPSRISSACTCLLASLAVATLNITLPTSK